MSTATLALLGRELPTNAKAWQRRLNRIADLLVAEYGTPSLGNFRNPVKEIFYIVLSARTTEQLYKRAHKRLWSQFPTLDAIASASLSQLRACVDVAGLGSKRAAQIKAIANRLRSDLGKDPPKRLMALTTVEVYAYLRTLPGVGPKSALCVMMYSLGIDVFPVDAHVHRTLRRIGAIKSGAKHYHAQDQLPGFIPNGRSNELHVALVLHGRQVCTPRTPHCAKCPIARLCNTGRTFNSALSLKSLGKDKQRAIRPR